MSSRRLLFSIEGILRRRRWWHSSVVLPRYTAVAMVRRSPYSNSTSTAATTEFVSDILQQDVPLAEPPLLAEGGEDLLQKIRVVNELRKKEIARRMHYCKKSLRMPQSTLYNNIYQAIDAAKLYAVQANQSTLPEVQHWRPYTPEEARHYWQSLAVRHVLHEKKVHATLESYEQSLHITSIFLVVRQNKSHDNQVVVNYPRSTLKLLTLLRGHYNAAVKEPLPAAMIQFFLHRRDALSFMTKTTETVTDHGSSTLEEEEEKKDATSVLTLEEGKPAWNASSSIGGEEVQALEGSFTIKDEERACDASQGSDAAAESRTPVSQEEHGDPSTKGPMRQPFHQSMADYESMITCLEQARMRMVSEALSSKTFLAPTDGDANALRQKLSRPDKTIQLASHLAHHLPDAMFRDFIDFLTKWTQSRTPLQRRIKAVEAFRFRDVLGHMYYSLVIRELSDFLLNFEDVTVPEEYSDAIYPYYTHFMSRVETDRQYLTALKKLTALQDRFVSVAMGLQSALLHGSPVIVMGDDVLSPKIKEYMENGVDQVNDVDAETESNSLFPPEENGIAEEGAIRSDEGTTMSTSSMSMRQRHKMEVEEVEKLDEYEIRPVAIRKPRVPVDLSKRRYHFVFEAIPLQLPIGTDAFSKLSSPLDTPVALVPEVGALNGGFNGSHHLSPLGHPGQGHDTSAAPSFSRMVFVDNLPIDIREERLLELFSRCGDIEALTMYNQRPDLDPGPLPQAELAQRRARQTRAALTQLVWRRPKTPVYAMITFATEEGYKKAMDESLRVFGMIVQRHPVRSVPSWTMTKLFIEDIPQGKPCIDLEYQLNEILEPNVFVGLDPGQDVSTNVHSCEIKFPSFEVAYESYLQLQTKLPELVPTTVSTEADPPSPCRINWMRTENDAVKWWSREYGFE